MEMKYVAAMVIGLIMLLGLFALINSKIDMSKDIVGVDDGGKTGIPNPACYSTCAMISSKDGSDYETCAMKCS